MVNLLRHKIKIRKYGLIAAAVLLMVGLFVPFSEVQSQEDNVYVRPQAEWSVYPHRFNSDSETVTFRIENVVWTGSLEGTATSSVLTDRDRIKYEGDKEVGIATFVVGIAPVEQTKADWDCDNITNACIFPVAKERIDNPSGTIEIEVERNKVEARQYKLVPVLNIQQDTDLIADVGTRGFAVEFVDGLSVSEEGPVENAGLVEASAVAVGTNESAFDSFVTGTLLTIINAVLTAILGAVRLVLWLLYSVLLLPILEALLTPNGFLDASRIPEFVQTGWVYVRDIMNLFFILVLIFAGIATMLRVGGYGLKSTISKTVLIALAVNFSLLAGEIVLNFAEILLVTFVNPDTVNVIQNGVDVDFSNVLSFADGSDAMAGTASLMFAIIYEIGLFVVLAAMGALFLIRLVGVWLLLIIAPGAYVLYLIPVGQKFLKQWWNKFLAYAFFAPLMAFIIALTAKLVRANTFFVAAAPENTVMSEAVRHAIQGVIVIALLGFGLKLASKMGIYAADTITNTATKAWKGASSWTAGLPFRGIGFGAKRAGGYVARKYNELTSGILDQGEGSTPSRGKQVLFGVLNPKAAAKGWQARSEELKKTARDMAEAKGRRAVENVLTRGKVDIPYDEIVARKQEQEYLQDYKNFSKERLIKAAEEIQDMGGTEGDLRRRAILTAAAANGFMDDIATSNAFVGKYGTPEEKEQGIAYSANILNEFLYDYLQTRGRGGEQKGMSEQAMRFITEDMEEYGKQTGHFEYVGHGTYDPKTKKWERQKDEKQAKYASGEFDKLGGRDKARAAPHNFTVLRRARIPQRDKKGNIKEDEDGNVLYEYETDEAGNPLRDEKGNIQYKHELVYGPGTGEIDEFSRQMIDKMGYGVMREAQHLQGRLPDWLIFAHQYDHKKGVLYLTPEQKKDFEKFESTHPDFAAALVAHMKDEDPRKAGAKGTDVNISIAEKVELEDDHPEPTNPKDPKEVRVGRPKEEQGPPMVGADEEGSTLEGYTRYGEEFREPEEENDEENE